MKQFRGLWVVSFLLFAMLGGPVLADGGEGGGERSGEHGGADSGEGEGEGGGEHGGGGEGGGEGGHTEMPSESTIYFPDYVDGEGWSVQLVLGNLDPANNATVDVEVYDQQGAPVTGFFDLGTSVDIPSQGSRTLKSPGGSQIRRGWIAVRSQTASLHGLLTYRDSATGIEVGVKPVPLGGSFALFIEESSNIGTGLALFRPDAGSQIEFQLLDEEGNDPIGAPVVLPPGDFQQAALTLPEWYMDVDQGFLREFRGLLFLRATDGSSFAPLGLRFGKQTGLLSAIPVISLGGASGCPVSGSGSGEPGESGTQYGLSDTAREVRSGVELIAGYDRESQMFTGTVQNKTNATVRQVRVEVHLSNGVELGPTPRVDLAPGETKSITLDATGQNFTCFSIHVELGANAS